MSPNPAQRSSTTDEIGGTPGHQVVDRADAHLEWAALAEPGDEIAGWLVHTLGAVQAREWLDTAVEDPVTATMMLAGYADEPTVDQAVAASERWGRRREQSQAEQLRDRAFRCGARPITPGDAEWPAIFDDLGHGAPMALWARGNESLDVLVERSVAVVGARASTAYGEHMAASIAGDLAGSGWTVMSGGAYGIDAAAHKGALATGGPTVAVMAGGVDRLYPAGNQYLLEKIIETGAVVSETPPGWAPHRHRFLQRNRLIACANATVVVEAGFRSGALSTAIHAHELARPVGAVPGPVTSASSAGCHRLLRDTGAVLVTHGADVVELAGPLDASVNPTAPAEETGRLDFDTPHDRAVFDALGTRAKNVEDLAHIAGLTYAEVRAALGRMDIAGLVKRDAGRWRRAVSNKSAAIPKDIKSNQN